MANIQRLMDRLWEAGKGPFQQSQLEIQNETQKTYLERQQSRLKSTVHCCKDLERIIFFIYLFIYLAIPISINFESFKKKII